MANEQHQINSHNTSDRLDSQASSDIGETCIELVLVTRLFHSVTVSQSDHFSDATCIYCLKLFFFLFFFGGGGGGGGALSSNVFTISWRVLISTRPPRVFRHFKRSSCTTLLIDGSFLAANKQLWEHLFLSVWLSVCPHVCLSVCHTFFTVFLSSYHHENFRSYYQWQKWCPCKRSRS